MADTPMEKHWARFADAVRELGGTATRKQVAGHLGLSVHTVGPYLEGAVRYGLLDRRTDMQPRRGRRSFIYSIPATEPTP